MLFNMSTNFPVSNSLNILNQLEDEYPIDEDLLLDHCTQFDVSRANVITPMETSSQSASQVKIDQTNSRISMIQQSQLVPLSLTQQPPIPPSTTPPTTLGDKKSIEEQEEWTEEDYGSNMEPFEEALLKFIWSYDSLQEISCFINLLTELIIEHKHLVFKMQDLFEVFFEFTTLAISDSKFNLLAPHLSNFFEQVAFICDNSFNGNTFPADDNWLHLAINFGNHLKDIFQRSNNNEIALNRDITLSLVPMVLNSILIFCLYRYQILKLANIFELFTVLYESLRRLQGSSNNDHMNDLFYCLNRTSRSYNFISNLLIMKHSEEKVKPIGRLVCFFISYAGADLHKKRSMSEIFTRMMGNRLVGDLAWKLNITKLELFLGLLKEISDRLTELICNDGYPYTIIMDCMTFFFDIHYIPNDLFRYLVPRFVLLHNEHTTRLFEYIKQNYLKNRSVTGQIIYYLTNIVSACFYKCDYSIDFIYEVFTFLNEYCDYNLLKYVFENLEEMRKNFMLNYSQNPDASLAGLSFIYCLETAIQQAEEDGVRNLPLEVIKTSIDLNSFKNDSRRLETFLQIYFPIYSNEFRTRISNMRDNIGLGVVKKKVVFFESYRMLLVLLDKANLVRFFQLQIFNVIKFMFGNMQHSVELWKSALNTLSTFVKLADEAFGQSEIASICLLIMPYVKLLPDICVPLYQELILERNHPIDFFYQLYFVFGLPKAESISKEIEAKIAFDRGLMEMDQTPLIDRFKLSTDPTKIDTNQLILYLRTKEFGHFCREMLYPLEHLNRNDQALNSVALRKLQRMLNEIRYKGSFEFYLFFNEAVAESARDVILDFGIERSDIESGRLMSSNSKRSRTTSLSNIQQLVDSIVTVGDFFNYLMLTLLKSIKYLTDHCRTMALDCLGALGAVNGNFLGMSMSCRFIDSDKLVDTETDFCYQDNFDPRKKEFKLLLLEALASMIGNTTTMIEYNLLAFGLQMLQPVFRMDNHDVMDRLLDLSQLSEWQESQQVRRTLVYYKRQIIRHLEEKYPGNSKAEKQKRMLKEYQMMRILFNEIDVPVDARRDMKPPLRDVVLAFDNATYKFRPPEPEAKSVDSFFDKVNPTMSFNTFLAEFTSMLYGCFIYPAQNSDPDRVFEPEAGPPVEYEQIFSQAFSMESVIAQPSNRNDWHQIYTKLNELRIPKAIFFISSFSLTKNLKLCHLLMPSMLILSLGLGRDQVRKEFIRRFRTMIESMIRNELYFINELGPMFVELLCALFDHLTKWRQNREFLHNHIIEKLFLKNCVNRFDNEYNGVKMFLDELPISVIIHLTYQAKLYHRSLYYLESYIDDNRSKLTTIPWEALIRDNCEYFYRIFSALKEKESLDALNRFHLTSPTLTDIFLRTSLGTGTTNQVIAGAKLISTGIAKRRKSPLDNQNNLEDAKKLALICDNQQRYIASLSGLQQDLALFWREPEEMKVPAFEKYQIESAIEMNSWEALTNIVEKKRESVGFNHPPMNQTFGHILAGFYNQVASVKMDDIINDVRESFMPALNAAMLSNCRTAYARAYSSTIVPLHILKDIEDFREYLRLYVDLSATTSQMTLAFNGQLKLWRVRNRLLPQATGDRLMALSVQKAMIQLMQTKYQDRFGGQCCLTVEYFRYLHECMYDALMAGDLDVAYGNAITALHVKNCTETSRTIGQQLNQMESIEFTLNLAKVLWCREQYFEAIQIIKTEIDAKHRDLQRHIYLTLTANEKFDNLEAVADALEIPWESIQQPVKGVRLAGSEKFFARLQLQYARYCDERCLLDSHPATLAYQAVIEADPNWEEGHYRMGMFYLRLVKEIQQPKHIIETRTVFGNPRVDETINLRANIICSLANSLRHGYNFVTISLPLMWEIWVLLAKSESEIKLKQGSLVNQRALQNVIEIFRTNMTTATNAIHSMEQSVNSAIFFVILDQVIANIANPCEDIRNVVAKLLIKLIANYRYHMAWQFALPRSNREPSQQEAQRQKFLLAQNYLNQAKEISPTVGPYFAHFTSFIDNLEKMSKFKLPKAKNRQPSNNSLSLSTNHPALLKAFETMSKVGKFVLPCNNFFLPNLSNLEKVSDDKLFEQFFRHIFIEDIENDVAVMKSLQEPKRVTFRCSDGKRREILSKYNDDLRKDRCMINFCNLFNECRRGTVPAISSMSQIDAKYTCGEEERRWADRRADRLALQTYFVVPLSSVFGVIEWLPSLQTIKSLIEGEYTKTPIDKEKYDSAKLEFLRAVFQIKPERNNEENVRTKRIEEFQKYYPRFKPPVFQNWFRSNFLEAYSWWLARRNFTRSAAVYSMLGYILGLGDRHAENILIDSNTGQVVHVDFNCLFNVGEEFHVPERVPFRLTHNMTAAMGVFGHEGLFRKTCEDVLVLLRQYRELFNIQVNTLFDDPLLDWRREASQLNANNKIEPGSRAVFNVEARLFGIVSRSKDRKVAKGKAISVEGQVDYVIKEATNLNNLGAMYYGWASYI